MARWMLALPFALALACESGPSHYDVGPSGQGSFGNGRILISWSFPSADACRSIDHLTLSLDNGAQQISISPIPCNLTRFRYDGLPEGSANLQIDAFDVAGCQVSTGGASLDVTPTLPSAPSPTVALSAPIACH